MIVNGYKKIIGVGLIFFLISINTKAQSNSWSYFVETDAVANPAGKLPFWFRANQYGNIPLAGTSLGFIGSIYKKYDTVKTHSINWSAGIQGRENVGAQTNLIVIEAFVKAKKGIFELSLGRTKDVSGIVDTTLSSGMFSISGNALGIPKATLEMSYYTLPFFDKLFAIKGSYSFGYFGKIDIGAPDITFVRNAVQYYQQNTLYVKLGHDNWKLKLFGGINHNVMYGNEQEIFGPHYTLSNLQATIYAAIGKTYHNPDGKYDSYLGGKVGNHIGSIDVAAQYEYKHFNVLLYHQFIYDVGAIGHFANITDGISGISITNNTKNGNKLKWKKVLFEFIYTKNQAGQFNSKSPSGDEDYYNDFEFANGWSYKGLNLGNPLLTSKKYTRADLIINPADYSIDNRIIALHSGIQGSIDNINLTMKLTYSKNYGTYGTAIEGHSTGAKHFPPLYGIFNEVDQFSGYVAVNKLLKNNLSVEMSVAGDAGKLYYNSIGLMLSLKKSFF